MSRSAVYLQFKPWAVISQNRYRSRGQLHNDDYQPIQKTDSLLHISIIIVVVVVVVVVVVSVASV
jgi:uncharacterized membrane protein YidH (DUF202 family)